MAERLRFAFGGFIIGTFMAGFAIAAIETKDVWAGVMVAFGTVWLWAIIAVAARAAGRRAALSTKEDRDGR